MRPLLKNNLRIARAGDHRHDHGCDGVGFSGEGQISMAIDPERADLSRISEESRISGKLNFQEPAEIDGEVEGEITGGEIVIAPTAVVTARITAAKVTIGGQVKGEIVARERIELLPSARLRCTIVTPTLVLTEGAQFDGDCRMLRGSPDVRVTVHGGPSGTSARLGK
jgi:cytoskeletal protein CcmA (bactofilin family)